MASPLISQFGLCDFLDPYPVGVNRSLSEKPLHVALNSSLGGCPVLGEECTSRSYFYVNLVDLLLPQELVISEIE